MQLHARQQGEEDGWASHKCSPIVFPLTILCGHHCRPLAQRQWVEQCSPCRGHESSWSESQCHLRANDRLAFIQHTVAFCIKHNTCSESRRGYTDSRVHRDRCRNLLPTNTATGKLRSRLADIHTHDADSTSRCSCTTLYLFSVR